MGDKICRVRTLETAVIGRWTTPRVSLPLVPGPRGPPRRHMANPLPLTLSKVAQLAAFSGCAMVSIWLSLLLPRLSNRILDQQGNCKLWYQLPGLHPGRYSYRLRLDKESTAELKDHAIFIRHYLELITDTKTDGYRSNLAMWNLAVLNSDIFCRPL